MAIVGTQLTAFNQDSSSTTYTTSSVTPGANRLVLAFVTCYAPGGAVAPSGLTGNGLTWVKVDDFTLSGIVNCSLWRAMGASPSAGGVTVTWAAAPNDCCIHVADFSGVNTGGTNGSAAVLQPTHATGTGTAVLVTLGAFSDSGNGTYGGVYCVNIVTQTGGSGFTVLSDAFNFDTQQRSLTEWKATNDTTVDATLSASQNWIAIACELAIPPAGGTAHSLVASSPRPRRLLMRSR